MREAAGGNEENGEEDVGQNKQEAGKGSSISEMDVARSIIEGMNRIAAAIEANAKATELLARATAGEFDADGTQEPELDMAGRPLR